jgi:hypothetical protein
MASACSNSHPLSSSRYIKCFPIHASRYVADEVVAVVLDFAPPSCRSKRATHRNSGSSGLISSSTLFLPAALRSSILLLVFLTSCCSRAREYVRVVILERGRRVGFFQRVENAAPDGGLFFYFLTVVRRSTSPLPSSRVCRFQSCRWFLRVQTATWDSVGQTTRHFSARQPLSRPFRSTTRRYSDRSGRCPRLVSPRALESYGPGTIPNNADLWGYETAADWRWGEGD